MTELGESEAIQEVTDKLKRFASSNENGQPVFDLVFLGMGEDAHVASLFPGDAEAFGAKLKAPVPTKKAEAPIKKTFLMINKDCFLNMT